MNLVDKILLNALEEHLIKIEDKVLIACSGGKDSMTLTSVLIKSNIKIGLAYFDHETRNGASKKDGEFVEAFAKSKGIPYYSASISAYQEVTKSINNFQHDSRIKRYRFLEEIAKKYDYDKIATAHHAQDVIETFFINLARGSGMEGLSSIPAFRGNIIRPLISISLEDIEQYVSANDIPFVQDDSNFENNYVRNQFRNQVLPSLQLWNNNFNKGTSKSIRFIRESKAYIDKDVNHWLALHSKTNNNVLSFSLVDVLDHHSPILLLYNIIKIYSFTSTQCQDILGVSQNGKTFLSSSHRILVHQGQIELRRNDAMKSKLEINISISDLIFSDEKPDKSIDYIEIPPKIELEDLEIRNWKPGDFLQTKIGKKKLKKIFSDAKIRVEDKLTFQLLAKGSEIFWIFGLRKAFFRSEDTQYLYLHSK